MNTVYQSEQLDVRTIETPIRGQLQHLEWVRPPPVVLGVPYTHGEPSVVPHLDGGLSVGDRGEDLAAVANDVLSGEEPPQYWFGEAVMKDATPTNPLPDGNTTAERAEVIREMARSEAPKHGRLLRSGRDGQVLSAVMRPFFALSTPPGQGVLTTTGRKSGKPRHKCIRAIRRGDTAYVVMLRPPALAIERPTAVSSWVWNIRADPNIRLRLGRRAFAGITREVTDPVELEQARVAITETVHLIDYGECGLHLRGLPTRAKIKALHRYWFATGMPLAIDLKE